MIVIPDIHGFSVALREIVDKFTGRHFIFLGDIIDRGPDVKGCYKIIKELHAEGRATLLLGNHEDMAVDTFVNNDGRYGGISWHHGLHESIESYQIEGDPHSRSEFFTDFRWYVENCHDYVIVDGNKGGVLISHGARPLLDADGSPQNLDHIWNRPGEDKNHPLPEGVEYSVHGHTPVQKPVLNRTQQAIYLDLGMYDRQRNFSGRYAVLDILNREVWVRAKTGNWLSEHYPDTYFNVSN